MISLIAAMANNRVIGLNNQMPWHLPADLKHFKSITLGKPVIMGRKTYESIGKSLPGRKNIIISRQSNLNIEGCTVTPSIDAAIEEASDAEEIIIMGGATIYQQTLSIANRLYLTFINLDTEGDAHFPKWDEAEWSCSSSEKHNPDEKNTYSYTFTQLDRI